MPTLSPQVTPYYGGGQVLNPANVIQVTGTPSSAAVHNGLGTLAVENSAAAAWILASLSGGSATWVNIAGGAGSFSSLTSTGNLSLTGAGSKILINAGTPASASTGTSAAMVAGVIAIASTAVTTSSVILYDRNTLGGTAGQVSITAQTAGSFTLTSGSSSETSTFNYLIIN